MQLIVNYSYKESIIISYDKFQIGTSNVNLTLIDLVGNNVSYIFNLTLYDHLDPVFWNTEINRTLIHPNNRVSLSWKIFDIRPAYYTLYLDEAFLQNASWDELIYIVLEFSIGEHILRLEVYDTSSNFIVDKITVAIIDEDAPIIHHFKPISRLMIEEGDSIEVQCLAEDANPGEYLLHIDDTLYELGTWTDEIQVEIGNLTIGIHNISLIVMDKSSNSVKQNLIVEVIIKTTISYSQHVKFFGLDRTSIGWLILIATITGLVIGIRRIRRRIRNRGQDT